MRIGEPIYVGLGHRIFTLSMYPPFTISKTHWAIVCMHISHAFQTFYQRDQKNLLTNERIKGFRDFSFTLTIISMKGNEWGKSIKGRMNWLMNQ